MKKLQKGRKFNRERDQRRALLKTLAVSLLLKEKIKTTEAKAKELSPFVQRKITRAKKGDLSARRYLLTLFPERIVKKLIEDISVRYKDRNGGYTRVIKLGQRKSDSAKMAIIELV
ncbi:MAG: 50S ribosomal protein L17 [Candidatus Pacebacteria bacterium]|nr:50S ribosomal protein L17 [Candidatus Paceibacterota bacterium]